MCITQYAQFFKCVNSSTCEGIDQLDQRNTPLKKTLQQLTLEFPAAHFMSIDLNWSNSGHAIIYPMKSERIAQERIASLRLYLHESYRDSMLQLLSIRVQALIHKCVQDEEIGRLLKKLDRELDEIFQMGDHLYYLNIYLITKEDVIPSGAVASNTFIP